MHLSNYQIRFIFSVCIFLFTQEAFAGLEDDFKQILFKQVSSAVNDTNIEIVSDIVEIRFEREFEGWKKNLIAENSGLSKSDNQSTIISESKKQPSFVASTDKENTAKKHSVEVGIRYWYGKNNTKFDSHSQDATKGDPNATLNWTNMKSNNIELLGKVADIDDKYFVKGLIGGNIGSISSGQIQDIDYYAGQTTFADTTSKAKEISASYIYLDVGKDIQLDFLKVSPFIGFFYSKQLLDAYGGTVNAITSGNYWAYNMMGWTVGQVFDDSVKPFNYETIVSTPRVGIAFDKKVGDFETFLQFVYMPRSHITLNDSHKLDTNKVTNAGPNAISNGYGFGYAYEFLINYLITDNSKLGVGFKYEEFLMKNKDFRYNTLTSGWYNDVSAMKQLSIKKYGTLLNYQLTF